MKIFINFVKVRVLAKLNFNNCFYKTFLLTFNINSYEKKLFFNAVDSTIYDS